jgi:hypothetical protein
VSGKSLYLDGNDTAAYLKDRWGIDASPKSLANRRSNGRDPIPYRRLPSGRVVHSVDDVDTWAERQLSQRFSNTTQERATGRWLPEGAPNKRA